MKKKWFICLIALLFVCFSFFGLTACGEGGIGGFHHGSGDERIQKIEIAFDNIEENYEKLLGFDDNENGSQRPTTNNAQAMGNAVASEDEALEKIDSLKWVFLECEDGFLFTDDTKPVGIDQFMMIKAFFDMAKEGRQGLLLGQKYTKQTIGEAYLDPNNHYRGGKQCSEKTEANKYIYDWTLSTSIDIDDADLITCLAQNDIKLKHGEGAEQEITKEKMYVEIYIDYDFKKTSSTNYKLTMKTISNSNLPADEEWRKFPDERYFGYDYMSVKEDKVEEFRHFGFQANKDIVFDETHSCFEDVVNDNSYGLEYDGSEGGHWWKDNIKYKILKEDIQNASAIEKEEKTKQFISALCDGLGLNNTALNPEAFATKEGIDTYMKQFIKTMGKISGDEAIYLFISTNTQAWGDEENPHPGSDPGEWGAGCLVINNKDKDGNILCLKRNKVGEKYYDSHLYDLYKEGFNLLHISSFGQKDYYPMYNDPNMIDVDDQGNETQHELISWYLKREGKSPLKIDLNWSAAKLLQSLELPENSKVDTITLIAKQDTGETGEAKFKVEDELWEMTPSEPEKLSYNERGEILVFYSDGFVQNIDEIRHCDNPGDLGVMYQDEKDHIIFGGRAYNLRESAPM